MTKLTLKAVVLFAVVVAFEAQSQNYQPPPHFDHIVIIVQENRTPDNIFGSSAIEHLGCGFEDPFEPGVDIENGGPNKASSNNGGPRAFLCRDHSRRRRQEHLHGYKRPNLLAGYRHFHHLG